MADQVTSLGVCDDFAWRVFQWWLVVEEKRWLREKARSGVGGVAVKCADEVVVDVQLTWFKTGVSVASGCLALQRRPAVSHIFSIAARRSTRLQGSSKDMVTADVVGSVYVQGGEGREGGQPNGA